MKYVYLLESIDHPDKTYVGLTDDLKVRFAAHNAGRSPHTSNSSLGGWSPTSPFQMTGKRPISNAT
jgi:hypothetical protein